MKLSSWLKTALETYPGFNALSDIFNIVKGTTLYVTGAPTSGKSEFILELLIFTAQEYGWKHLIFSPEIGYAKDITLELCAKWTMKGTNYGSANKITEMDLFTSLPVVSEHFKIIESDYMAELDDFSMDEFLTESQKYLNNYKFDTITIDPWDEIGHDIDKEREDQYLKKKLSIIRRFARKNNIYFIIAAHPRTPQKTKDGTYLPATAYDISGGSKWYNKGETIISVYRPPLLDSGEPNVNMTKIIIQKAKPKHVGTKGDTELYFDRDHNRFYIPDLVTGMKIFARKKDETLPKLAPLKSFTEPIRSEEEPF
jgi:twinkle protein